MVKRKSASMTLHAGRGGRQSGFTYLGLLLMVALMGTALAAVGTVWRTVQQREKERELLFIGHELRHAIEMYYELSPGGVKVYPKRLEDLLEDKRYLTIQRYLRKIYVDPMTGIADWGVVLTPANTIMGVYSQSQDRPFKTFNFIQADKAFEGTDSYADWKFVYVPRQAEEPAVEPLSLPGVAMQ